MDSPELRPLSLGELLDRTFTYYRRHFWLFVGIMAIPQTLIVAVSVFMESLQQTLIASPGAAGSPKFTPVLLAGLSFSWVFLFIAYLILYALALGATTFAISELHLGRASTARAAYRSLRGHIWRLLDLMLTVMVRVFLAGILIVALPVSIITILPLSKGFPGPLLGGALLVLVFVGGAIFVGWLFLRYGCAVPALLLENLKARQAIRRSIALTKGNLLRVLAIVFLMTMVRWTVALIFQGPFLVAAIVVAAQAHRALPFWLTIMMNIFGGAGGALAGPLLMIGLALLYYDVRVRKEAFDLQLMMSALDAGSPTAAAAPGAQTSGALELERTSVWKLVLLTGITFGLYYPFWFIRRRAGLNGLRSTEKVGLAVPIVVSVLWLTIFTLSFAKGYSVSTGGNFSPGWLPGATGLVNLIGGVFLLLQAFKVKRIIEDNLASTQTGPFSTSMAFMQGSSLSGPATFFFGIFYLQSKINELIDAEMKLQPAVGADVIPAI